MSLLRIEEVRARCNMDRVTHCWVWTGATSSDGVPRIHTFDHARLEKRTMSGPMAVWNIAHGEAPRQGHMVMRCCGRKLCLNPAHLRQFRDKAEMGLHIRRAGWRKGTAMESRRANVKLAQAAAGTVATPPDVVLAIRAEPAQTTNKALGERYGISHQTVSRIRLGQSHRHLMEAACS